MHRSFPILVLLGGFAAVLVFLLLVQGDDTVPDKTAPQGYTVNDLTEDQRTFDAASMGQPLVEQPSEDEPSIRKPLEQGPSIESVRNLLASDNQEDIAWGGFRASEYRLIEVEKDLCAALVRLARQPGKGRSNAERTVLDALIQLGVKVPAQLLLNLSERGIGVQELILLARDPKKNRDLLLADFRRCDASTYQMLQWLALGNLLVQSKPMGFGAKVFSRLKAEILISVQDPDSIDFKDCLGMSMGGGVGCGIAKFPSGYPPIAFYKLIADGGQALAPGMRSVGYKRELWTKSGRGRSNFVSSHRQNERNAIRWEWTAALLELDESKLPLQRSREETHVFRDKRTYREAVETLIRQTHLAHDEVAGRLVQRGLMDHSDRMSCELNISLRVEDNREAKDVALPEISTQRRP